MSPEIEYLISLQGTDREIQRLKAEIAELPTAGDGNRRKTGRNCKLGLRKLEATVKADDAGPAEIRDARSHDLRQKIPSIVISRSR